MFAGYSGLEMGVMQVLDAQPAWFAEIDEAPARILQHHYPDVPNLGDVTKVDWGSVPPIDILTAGYPCQPFSQAGHRIGTNDERHLWPRVLYAIKRLRPRIAFFENVRGHLTLGLAEVLEDLASIGWDAQWACVRASDVGAPHHRERLFILATNPDSFGQQESGLTCRPAPQIAGDNNSLGPLPDTISIRQHGRGTTPEQTQGAHSATNRHSSGIEWGKYAPAVRRWERLTRPAPAPTELNTRGKPRLNAEFAEWLMGLPAGWVTNPDIGLTRSQQLKALGNGVVPPQAAYALQHLLTP